MRLWTYKTFEFTANCVASMDIAVTFFFANCVTMELLFCLFCFVTFYFSLYCSAPTRLHYYYFTISTPSFMTNLRAFMTTWKFFFARHTTAWDRVFATFSLNLRNHHQLVSTTRAGFLKFGSFFAGTTRPFMALFLAFMVTTI